MDNQKHKIASDMVFLVKLGDICFMLFECKSYQWQAPICTYTLHSRVDFPSDNISYLFKKAKPVLKRLISPIFSIFDGYLKPTLLILVNEQTVFTVF